VLQKVIGALLSAQVTLEKEMFQVTLTDIGSVRELVGRHRGLGEALAIIAELQEGEEERESRY
jgi:hypothetical protein